MNEVQNQSNDKTPQWIKEFQAFIMRGNVIDLAVGIIVGAAFTTVVNSLVKDIFNPIIGLLIGGIDFSNIFITLKGAHVQTLEEAQRIGAVTLNIGVFLNAIIQFLIVGFAVFWLVKMLNKLYSSIKTREEKTAAPVPSKQEILLEEIRDALTSKHNI
ncbi:Large-conductance mechanosensitive channel [Commensalibacter sp. Nvir]|uniref:large-conductance mechanosensitive channel protein MscL n=1 Tax=Commensalibacter sp. Nvir TaxID=3069817 RepID=UPI002D526D5D|nr:Large-conductance mechanosensitive channel [Commensalibacter sp. Nvir]